MASSTSILQLRLFITTSLLLLLSGLPTSYAAKSAASYPKVPPPLPESEWVGKTSLNYTALHEKYGVSLFCSYTPIGVFGYYYRYGIFFSMGFSIIFCFTSGALIGNFFPYFNLIFSLAPLAFSYYLLFQNVQSLRHCPAYQLGGEDAPGNHTIRRLGYCGVAAASMFALGSTLLTSILLGIRNVATKFWEMSMLVLLFLAMCLQFSVAMVYFLVVGKSLQLGLGHESVRSDAAWAIYGPIAALVGLLAVIELCFLIMICAGYSQQSFDFCKFLWRWVVIAGIATVAVYHAIATIKVGNVVGDPFGGYVLKEPTGIADAVLLAVPAFQLGMMMLSKYTGRFEILSGVNPVFILRFLYI